MPNMNVPARLEKIRQDLSRVADHIGEHSGISRAQAKQVDTTCTEIATLGVQVAALARQTLAWRPGDDTNPAANVLEDVRNAVDG